MSDEEVLKLLEHLLRDDHEITPELRDALTHVVAMLKDKIAMDEVYKPVCCCPDLLD